jgi:hypothetical protein
MAGLAIDCGLLLAAQRGAQNAADAAAMAAAMADLSGQGDPGNVATTFVTQLNDRPSMTVSTFNNPPAAGPHAGSHRYYEVVVSYPVTTLFMPAIGAGRSQSVQARAVAGYEPVSGRERVAALDPTASPGLAVSGGAGLVVDGCVVVNSTASPAATVTGGAVEAAGYYVSGPTVSGTFNPYPGTSGRLSLNSPPSPDPLTNLPTPATAASSANHTATPPGSAWSTQQLGSPLVWATGASGLVPPNYVDSNGTVQLYPGVYQSITVTGGTVVLNPGVYVLRPSNNPPYALDLTGGTVTGNGVMFYNTGADFVPSTGYPDYNDTGLYDPSPSGTNAPPSGQGFQGNFAGIRLDASGGARIDISALSTVGCKFNGMIIYQRRANTQPVEITGGGLTLGGTVYAKWAPLFIGGGGSSQAQFIAGSVQVSGGSTLTLGYGSGFGKAEEVFLVE